MTVSHHKPSSAQISIFISGATMLHFSGHAWKNRSCLILENFKSGIGDYELIDEGILTSFLDRHRGECFLLKKLISLYCCSRCSFTTHASGFSLSLFFRRHWPPLLARWRQACDLLSPRQTDFKQGRHRLLQGVLLLSVFRTGFDHSSALSLK